ncbi:MAG: cytochrome c3 family protein [Pirellulales bacterium]|nr:cytochrome c3 family protein [Pirellulales bacterium]
MKPQTQRITTVVLGVGLVFALLILIAAAGNVYLPGDHRGFEPTQPIAFSHQLHAGDLGIGCHYCHSAAEDGRHAGIPAADTCMNCHQTVTANWASVRAEDKAAEKEGRKPGRIVSPELQKLYDYLALDAELKPDPSKHPSSIPWVRIHDLPDFVYFDHRAHVQAGVECQKCHGPVETMERVRQVESLSMGWCVNCHRDANQNGVNGRQVNASLDCATCHW